MVMKTCDKIEAVKTELEFACGYLFKSPPMITVDTSEDAPCVILDGSVCICYTYVEGYPTRMYELQKIVVEHNHPHEPDWIDYVVIKTYRNMYSAVLAAIGLWVGEMIEMNWGNQGHEQEKLSS